MRIQSIIRPDYYELRIVYADGSGSRQNFKRHGAAARKAKVLEQLNNVMKCRILWIKNRMNMPFVEKTEYIKGDRID